MNSLARIALGTSIFLAFLSSATADDESSDWTDRIDLYGDLRLRYEAIDVERLVSRDRPRFRARFGVKGQVNENVEVVFQLCSGGDNPVSCNQTFDDSFSSQELSIDLAYVDWQATDDLNVYGGKMKNPLFRAGSAPMVWDSDLHPEGIAGKYSNDLFFATLGAFSVEERATGDDSWLYAGQFGLTWGLGKKAKLTAGLGYFGYTNTIGNSPFYFALGLGNTVDDDGNYVYDYRNAEVFAQYDNAWRNWPISVYGHYTQNNEVDDGDTAYAFGAKIGSAKSKGKMEFSWTYMDIQADAVIAAFNDSDYAGGTTDSSGSLIKAKYAVTKNIILGGTFFVNEIQKSSDDPRDYNRMQLDIEFKFN